MVGHLLPKFVIQGLNCPRAAETEAANYPCDSKITTRNQTKWMDGSLQTP